MKKKGPSITKILLLIAIFLIEFATYTKNITFVTNYSQKLINFAIILLFIDSIIILLNLKTKIKNWFLYFIIVSISIFSFLKTNDSLLLQLCLIIICSLKVDFEDVIKKDIWFKLFLFLFIYIAYLGGHAIKPVFTRDGVIRYALGFNQPNALGFFLLSLFLEYVYLKRKKIKLTHVIIVFLPTLYLMNLAKSRASEISICLFILIYTISYIKKRIKIGNNDLTEVKKKPLKMISIIFLVLTLMSFYITYSYINGSGIAKVIDEILSERIYLQSIFLRLYDITLIGNEINYFDTLDNVYMRIILNFGIIVWFLYMYIYNSIISHSIKKNDNMIIMITFVFLIYGLMEWYIVRPAINIFLIYFSTSMLEYKKQKGE